MWKEKVREECPGFYERDMQILPSFRNMLLYVIVYVHDVELRQALVDPGSSLIIIPLSPFEVVGIPRDRIVEWPIKLPGLRGMHHLSLAISTSTWILSPYEQPLNFIYFLSTFYHLLLRNLGSTSTKLSLSHITNASSHGKCYKFKFCTYHIDIVFVAW